MRKRNEATFEERRQQIMAGALEAFARKGFTQATNKDVAEAAGIQSPGLIYHYFASKEALLRAAVEQHAPPLQLLARADALLALPPEEFLTQVGQAYGRMAADPRMAASLRVLFGEALRSPRFAELFGEVGPLRILQFLTDYLRRQMEAGCLRPVDPAVAARCFIGPLVTYLITGPVLGLTNNDEVDWDGVVATTVELFLRGLRVE
jgi:TetR/AcrR family transcriptional regulator, mexJK operon transcriptional repressor